MTPAPKIPQETVFFLSFIFNWLESLGVEPTRKLSGLFKSFKPVKLQSYFFISCGKSFERLNKPIGLPK
jgi:hypothetical protein